MDHFERLKYLSSAGHNEPRMFKFAGLGHYGEVVFERERKNWRAGFGPMPRVESDGFVSYPVDRRHDLIPRVTCLQTY